MSVGFQAVALTVEMITIIRVKVKIMAVDMRVALSIVGLIIRAKTKALYVTTTHEITCLIAKGSSNPVFRICFSIL